MKKKVKNNSFHVVGATFIMMIIMLSIVYIFENISIEIILDEFILSSKILIVLYIIFTLYNTVNNQLLISKNLILK